MTIEPSPQDADIKTAPICWQCGQNHAAVKLRLSICVVCAGIVEPPDEEQ